MRVPAARWCLGGGAGRCGAPALVALLVLWPAALSAQVAAPSLLPATPGVADATLSRDSAIVPVNAAVLGWGAPTRIAFGVIRSDRNADSWTYAGPPLPPGTTVEIPSTSFRYEGTYGGAVVQRDGYAFGFDGIFISDVAGDEKLESAGYNVAAATRWGESWALGAGIGLQADETNNSKSRNTSYSLGASWRALERLYVGAVVGRDQVKNTATSSIGSEFSGDRTSYGVGIGYLGGTGIQMHFELWGASLGAVNDGDAGTEPSQIVSLIAEARIGLYLMGYSYQAISASYESSDAKAELEGQSHEVTLGIADVHGFGLLYHYGFATTETQYLFKQSDYLSRLKTDGRSQAVTLVWHY